MFSSLRLVDAVLKLADPVITIGSSPSGSRSRYLLWMYSTLFDKGFFSSDRKPASASAGRNAPATRTVFGSVTVAAAFLASLGFSKSSHLIAECWPQGS
jgi:hypothetical protein